MAAPRPLAGRYAFTRRIRGTQRTIIWIARDRKGSKTVVASVLPAARAAALKPAVDLAHPHLASILEIIDSVVAEEVPGDEALPADSRVVVAEYVEGRNLQQRLDAGPVAVENALEWICSLGDALALLHLRGAVHGALSPRAAVVVRPEPAIVPVLTHLLAPPSGAYCSPERVTGGGPSEADDTWALAAMLYSALSRRAPFHGVTRTELARAIVKGDPARLPDIDDGLWAIVERAMLRAPESRFARVSEFRDALRTWMDETGVKSTGDFAPVAALIGHSEPALNVGDLSLVAALASPDSAQAIEPLSLDPALHRAPREEEPLEDISGDATELAAPVAPVAPVAAVAPIATPSPLPIQAPEAEPAPDASPAPAVRASPREAPRSSKSRLPLVLGLVAIGAISAIGGLFAGKVRHTVQTEAATADPGVDQNRTEKPTASVAAELPPTNTGATAGASAAPPTSPGEAPSALPEGSAAPAPQTPGDVNACMKAALPAGTVGTSDFGYLCSDKDMWGIGRKLDLQIAKHGKGPGMLLWVHLGRFDLAAIAVLWQRCCPGAVPFTAATPKGVCESLPATLTDVAHDPSSEHLDAYGASAQCFISRGVRYPAEWWDRIGPIDARKYFDQWFAGLPKDR